MAPAPGAEMMLAGKNCAVTPVGNPVTVSVMEALKVELGVVVIVRLSEAPAATLMEATEDAKTNVGAGATVTASVTTCFVEPLAAVTVVE